MYNPLLWEVSTEITDQVAADATLAAGAVIEKCIAQLAAIVAKNVKFLLNQTVANQFSAVIALKKTAAANLETLMVVTETAPPEDPAFLKEDQALIALNITIVPNITTDLNIAKDHKVATAHNKVLTSSPL